MRKSSKLALTLLGGLLAFVIFGGLYVAQIRGKLSARIEAIRLAGDPAGIADLVRPGIESGENAADHLTDISQRMAQFYNTAGKDLDTVSFNWRTGLSDQTLGELTAKFDQNAKLVDAHRSAAGADYLRWPSGDHRTPAQFTEELLANLSNARSVARFNRIHARFLAAQGKYDEAAAACVDQLRLCRLQDATPMLTGFLVNIACRNAALEDLTGILQSAKLSQQSYLVIEKELAAHDSMDRFTDALKTERAFGIDSFRSMFRTSSEDFKQYLDLMEDQITNAASADYRVNTTKTKPTTGLSAMVVPAIQQARVAMIHSLVVTRCVRILNAIQRNGRYDSTDQVKVDLLGLPTDATEDPFTGGDLFVVPQAGQWIIYSAGENQVDDGGSVGDQLDIGIAPVLAAKERAGINRRDFAAGWGKLQFPQGAIRIGSRFALSSRYDLDLPS